VSRRVLIPLALLGLFVAFFGEGFSIHIGQTPAVAWMDLAVGLAYIGAGLVAWRRRPDIRLGLLMTALGFAWFIGAWANTPPFQGSGAPHWDAYRIAVAFDALSQALLVHLLLAFPSGRVTSRPSRVVVAAGYANVLLLGFGRVLFIDFFARGIWAYYHYRGFQGYLALHPDRAIADAMQRAYEGVWAAVLLAAVVVIARRWYVSTTATRRSLAPLWFAGASSRSPSRSPLRPSLGGSSPQAGRRRRAAREVSRTSSWCRIRTSRSPTPRARACSGR